MHRRALVKRAVSRDFVGARVVDPTLELDAIRTIVVRNGVIAALLDDAPAAADPEVERVDCAGMVLCPGFIDPHVHLREPGDAHKETFSSALAAAADLRACRLAYPQSEPSFLAALADMDSSGYRPGLACFKSQA